MSSVLGTARARKGEGYSTNILSWFLTLIVLRMVTPPTPRQARGRTQGLFINYSLRLLITSSHCPGMDLRFSLRIYSMRSRIIRRLGIYTSKGWF